jgi:hypothetical protein
VLEWHVQRRGRARRAILAKNLVARRRCIQPT